MLQIGMLVTREDTGTMGQVYGITENPDGYTGSYTMYRILWVNGLSTAVHESRIVETDMGWVVRAPSWLG